MINLLNYVIMNSPENDPKGNLELIEQSGWDSHRAGRQLERQIGFVAGSDTPIDRSKWTRVATIVYDHDGREIAVRYHPIVEQDDQ